MRTELVENSMFANTPLYNIGGDVVFGLMRPILVTDPSDQVYTVPQAAEHRFDLISEIFYGTPELWWLIASVNNVIDPLVGVSAGTKLRIPTRERLAKEGILNS